MEFKNVMFNTQAVLVHRPTGRKFFYIPAHSVELSVNGLSASVRVTETLSEIINEVMCPVSIPTTFLYDEWDVGTLEAELPGVFRDENRVREADAENRVGLVNIAMSLYQEYGPALRSAMNFTIKNESYNTASGDVIIMFSSPDVPPVLDGQPTPLYLISMYEGENRLSFELVKQVQL